MCVRVRVRVRVCVCVCVCCVLCVVLCACVPAHLAPCDVQCKAMRQTGKGSFINDDNMVNYKKVFATIEVTHAGTYSAIRGEHGGGWHSRYANACFAGTP